MHLAAFAFESACGFVHIVNRDVTHPHWWHAASPRIFRDRKKTGSALAIGGEDDVFHAGCGRILRAPADDVAVKLSCGAGVVRHDIVPEEFAGHMRCSALVDVFEWELCGPAHEFSTGLA
jgi:hypothetical protein